MKTYAVEIMGQSTPTYIVETDVVKLVQSVNRGAKLVLVGTSFINPSSISRIRRAYDVDASVVEEADKDLKQLIEGNKLLK